MGFSGTLRRIWVESAQANACADSRERESRAWISLAAKASFHFTNTPCDRNTLLVSQDHPMMPIRSCLDGLHSINSDDGGSADADKIIFRDFILQASDGLAKEMILLAHMQNDVIAARFDPIDLFGADESGP